ncbi:MAG: DUF4349 domain-containing protein [Ruminococcus sp.]|nr:DUF4349 domain-containing protein [Ruminococcus sp.]MCM1380990.1 DUF4349 domain-containing protein [Muribaculaceae bacterium]MCM1478658.1 DUF4349 domain-containing protein [Muribaculaceae bacterium]
MKRKILLSVLLCTALLTGCGAESSDKAAAYDGYGGDANGFYAVTTAASYESYDAAADEGYYEGGVEEPSAKAEGGEDTSNLAAENIRKEMLVYSCYMTVDTLEFDKSLSAFKSALESYGGFIETENFSDGGGGGRWYSENEQKWQSYSATVRVPSKDYEAFCNSAGELGDLRSKTSSVENLSQEYSDLSTTLEIYEAKEQRYIALLAEITEDEYAVEIERELTEIQIKIANIKTRMNQIGTDVAYSYVYFTLNEVKEYTAEPVKTDTFFDRLSYTLSDAGETFLDFLEGLLFFLIYALPYLILIGIVVFAIIFIVKKIKNRRKNAKIPEKEKTENSEKNGEKNPKK